MVARAELTRFLEQLDSWRARLDALVGSDDSQLSDEIRMASEELLVAREELQAQHDELVAALSLAALTSADFEDEFAGAGAAYVTTDRNGLILEANFAARAMLTWPPMHWAHRPLTAHFSLPTRIVVRSLMSRVNRRAGHLSGEAVLILGTDRQEPVVLAVASLPDAASLRWAIRQA
jgi:PAS domain-containing protein